MQAKESRNLGLVEECVAAGGVGRDDLVDFRILGGRGTVPAQLECTRGPDASPVWSVVSHPRVES